MNPRPFWPLAVPTWGAAERAAAHAVIDGEDHTAGDRVRRFETELAAYHGVRRAVLVNSGSSANLLAVAALDELRDRFRDHLAEFPEVIVPAIAWATTYAPLHQHGYRLAVVDVDPGTLNVDPDQVEAALGPRTVGLVGVSILGNPAPLAELRELARGRGLFFLEDNCESLGASIDGRRCGAFGDVGTLSFFFSHHLSTVEGGALLTDDADLADLAVCLRAHGWDRDLRPDSPLRSSVPGDGYRFLRPGYNLRSTELAAAVGSVQLGRVEAFAAVRRANAVTFGTLLGGDPRWATQRLVGYAVPFGFPLVFRSVDERDRARRALDAVGIEHRLITGGSFARHPVAARYDWRYATDRGTPNADAAHDRGLFVGNHPLDLTRQIETLHDVLDKEIRP